MTLLEQTKEILRLIGDDRLERLGLLKIKDGNIVTPRSDNTFSLFGHRSKRKDTFVDKAALGGLIDELRMGKKLIGVDHLGFCYKVDSKQQELEKITQEASKKGLHVYQEPSIDDADWLFVGDISDISNPLLEFLPLQGQPKDQWVDYWLPHIQFDIDTTLSSQDIKTLVQKYIQQPAAPFPIQIDGTVYIQRVNLGCIEGVNLMLDIATNNRNINYRRTWAKLI